MKLPFKWMRKRVSTALSDINKKFKKTVLCLVEKILSLFKHFKNLILNIFKAIKNGFLRYYETFPSSYIYHYLHCFLLC